MGSKLITVFRSTNSVPMGGSGRGQGSGNRNCIAIGIQKFDEDFDGQSASDTLHSHVVGLWKLVQLVDALVSTSPGRFFLHSVGRNI